MNFIHSYLGVIMSWSKLVGIVFILFLCFLLPIATVNAADGAAGPGWMDAQGPPVTPQEADAYYQPISRFNALALTPESATTPTSEISALARALKNDPRLIYEYVRNNVDYVPYFGSLKGATLTYLDGSGNDFDQASLMIALLQASNYTDVQYVYGQMTIPTSGDPNQKDMQHWLGVDANNSVISTVLGNGGIPGNQSGSNWIVNRVWVQLTISGTIYLFDPAFKPHQVTQAINLQAAMGYNKSALLSAAGGTTGTDYVQNLNETNLKSTLDGYSLSLADFIRTDYPNAQTSDLIGGSKIVPQFLTALPTSLDFACSGQVYWTDIPDNYVHKVRIQHGGIDQTLNIPDLAGQKLSIVYRSGTIFTASSLAKPIPTDPQLNLAPLGATTVDYQAIAIVPAGNLDVTLPNISVPWVSIDGSKSTQKYFTASSTSSASFGSIYPASAGASSNTITWGPITNPNSVTVQIVVTLTSNPDEAFSITAGAGTNNLGAGQSMNVTVKFSNAGQSAGTKTGQFKIQWQQTNGTAIGEPAYYDLTGYVANAMSLDGYGLSVQTPMNTPKTGSARISNNGTLPLSITAKSLTGTGAARFQFVSGSDAATTITAGGYQDIQITYLADVHGTQSAKIRMGFTYDGMTYSASDYLSLQGQAIYVPSFTGSYGFNAGIPNLSYPVNGTARLVNAGGQVLSITGFSITGTDAALFNITGGNSAGNIAAGLYRDINVRYLANSVGTHSAMLHVTFTYDGIANSIDLPLAGQTLSTPIAQLWLDDQMIAEEVEPVTGVDIDKMTVSVTHPYSTTFADQLNVVYNLKRGSTYAIVYDFGGSRLGRVLEKRERQMQTFRESGLADTSRQVLTESLNVIGMTWMRDTTLNANLLGQIQGVIDIRQHRFGIVAQETGYYIDVKIQLSSTTSIHGDTVANSAYFKATNHLASAMEHGVLEQMQSNSPAVSTVKLLQLNNADGKKLFMVTSANYAAIKPQLFNYSAQDLSTFQTSVNSGNTLILPENGKIALLSWSGKGYIDFSLGGTSRHVGMIIGGGYNGGYGATAAPVAITPVNTQINLSIAPSADIPKIGSIEPVDMATGFWMYNNTDLTLSGGIGGVAFKRSYNSGNNNMKDSLGYGWAHNYRLYVEPHSNSPFGLGQRQPLDAAALIVAAVSTLDIMNGTPDLNSWLVGALIGKWSMDKLTNNAASVHLDTDVLTFIKLPDGTFASPPGVSAELVLNGNLYQVNERFNRTINFGSDNNVSSVTDADGNAVNFTYSASLLQSVADNFGHTLTFHYTGALLTSVTDSASRGVSYGYTGNDLTSYTDPEGKVWTYGPDGNHRILTLKNPRNTITVTNVYDAFGQVQSQTMPRQTGNTTYNLYFSGYRNIEEDGAGHQTIYYFDNQKHLLGVENTLGQRNAKSYDGQNHVVSYTDPKLNATSYTYDDDNNLTVITNPLSKQTINTYDGQFHLTDVTDSLGHLAHTDYDSEHHPYKTTIYPATGKSIFFQKSYYANGLVNTSTDGRSVVTTLTPDSYGNPASSKTSTAPAITYVYDPIGRLTSLTDQVSSKTSFTYDKRSLLKTMTDPLTKTVTLNYYDDGTLNTVTDRNNKTTTFTYTPSGKTDTITYQGGATVSYTYDQNDFPTNMQDSIGATIYAPDAVNRLASITDPRNFTISYNTRDANGNVTQITYPGNKTISYTYDALNRVKTVTIDWLNKTATYIYDDAGRMTDLTQFNNTIAHYAYDNANRLTGLENRLSTGGSTISSYSYTLDANGNRTAINQIVPVGINVTPGSRDFTMNIKKDRLQQAGTTSFTYDDEGQLATKTGETYTFDDAHRVVSITGSVNHTYRYDGAGNRLEATRNGVTTRYIYDAAGNLLAEADGNNMIQKYYIYGNGLLGMVTSGGNLYSYHFDGTGHTVALTDASANVVNKYAYTPFGAIANQQETISQPFKYVGKHGVMSEPNGLYYMKARYYDSNVGRFVSEDPSGFGGGDVNLMAYVGGNPIMGIDPSGLINPALLSEGFRNLTAGGVLAVGGALLTGSSGGVGAVVGVGGVIYGTEMAGRGVVQIATGLIQNNPVSIPNPSLTYNASYALTKSPQAADFAYNVSSLLLGASTAGATPSMSSLEAVYNALDTGMTLHDTFSGMKGCGR